MPPQRGRGRPKKVAPTDSLPTPPTVTSPAPLKRKRGRPAKTALANARASTSPVPTKRKPGRPKKNTEPTSTSASPPPAKRQRGRPNKKSKQVRPSDVQYKAVRILDENNTRYLIEWLDINPRTGQPYKPTWQPKDFANKALVEEWEDDHEEEEWEAQGIVDEDEYYYLISWEADPKTGEVYEDTWEPKTFASKPMVKQWEARKAEMRARAEEASPSASTSNDEASASKKESPVPDDQSLDSDDELPVPSEDEEEAEDKEEEEEGEEEEEEEEEEDDDEGVEDALQQQLEQEMLATPASTTKAPVPSSKFSPKSRRRILQ